MFKRANKITALLVAAAAVVSVLPATAANAADVKRISSEDGTIYNAVAYKDGQFYVDGSIDDKDDAANYLSGGKFKALEDIDSGDEVEVYGSKYVSASNGDYYLDLTTGKETDDNLKEDDEDDAASAIRKNVKKDDSDRYANLSGSQKDSELIPTLKAIYNNTDSDKKTFSDVWYETSYGAASSYIKADNNGSASKFTVYSDAKGKYIDADYNLGKINVVLTTQGTATVKNTSDDDNGVRAKITHGETIGQDKDYIYRTATLEVRSENDTIKGFGSKNKTITKDTTAASVQVIQKISKAQDSGDVDDAKFAKTVNTYFLTDDEGKSVTPYAEFAVSNGKILNYEYTGGNLKAKTYTLKSTNGFYYTDESDGADVDVDVKEGYGFDVDGNLWALADGYIKEYNNDDDFDKIYKVDGSFDKLSVYDKNNMIAWNEDDEVYSVISGKGTSTDEEETPAVTTGWVEANGAWTYVNADGTKATGWLNLNGTWYYLDPATGAMATGWVNVNGTWYYLNPVSDGTKGAMKTGWVNVSGTWYYLNASGAMLTGWINDNGTWYYCNASGAMLANTVVDGYKLGANGAWVK